MTTLILEDYIEKFVAAWRVIENKHNNHNLSLYDQQLFDRMKLIFNDFEAILKKIKTIPTSLFKISIHLPHTISTVYDISNAINALLENLDTSIQEQFSTETKNDELNVSVPILHLLIRNLFENEMGIFLKTFFVELVSAEKIELKHVMIKKVLGMGNNQQLFNEQMLSLKRKFELAIITINEGLESYLNKNTDFVVKKRLNKLYDKIKTAMLLTLCEELKKKVDAKTAIQNQMIEIGNNNKQTLSNSDIANMLDSYIDIFKNFNQLKKQISELKNRPDFEETRPPFLSDELESTSLVLEHIPELTKILMESNGFSSVCPFLPKLHELYLLSPNAWLKNYLHKMTHENIGLELNIYQDSTCFVHEKMQFSRIVLSEEKQSAKNNPILTKHASYPNLALVSPVSIHTKDEKNELITQQKIAFSSH